MAVHDPLILKRWQSIFATWRSSGLSVAAFCRSRELNLFSFYRWRKILDDLDPSPASGPSPSFVPVRVVSDAVVVSDAATGSSSRATPGSGPPRS